MKLVINSSLCCRFLCCTCNQMWPSLGFTAINELRECARGGERSAAGLGSGSRGAWGWALGGRGLAGVSSLELWASTSPRAPERPGICPAPPGPSETAPVRRDPLPVAFPGIATFRGPGLGGEGVSTDLLVISPAPTVLKHLGTDPRRP